MLPTPTRVAMMVGAHNTIDVTVECQVYMGGCVGFFRKGGCRYLQNTIVCEEPLPRAPGMVSPGAHYRCPEACGGFLSYRSPTAPTILFMSGRLWSTVPAGVQGMVLVSWFDLVRFSIRPWSLPSGRPWSDGPSRSWSCQSEKSGKHASYGPPVRNAGSE